MAEKFISMKPGGGQIIKEAATTPTPGAIPALDETGKFPVGFMPDGIGATTKSFQTSESLSAGNLVNIFDDAGTMKVRKADASDVAKFAVGLVKEAFANGVTATVFFEGEVEQTLTGSGTKLFLSASRPGMAGDFESGSAVMQCVGFKTGTNTFNFIAEEPIEIAS